MHEHPTFDHTWRRLEEEAILVEVRLREPTSIPDYKPPKGFRILYSSNESLIMNNLVFFLLAEDIEVLTPYLSQASSLCRAVFVRDRIPSAK